MNEFIPYCDSQGHLRWITTVGEADNSTKPHEGGPSKEDFYALGAEQYAKASGITCLLH